MTQRFDIIFSFLSNFNQNENIYSFVQFIQKVSNNRFRMFNDMYNDDHENRRNRSNNRRDYIKNQN